MRISDWSSDVCSSDLFDQAILRAGAVERHAELIGAFDLPVRDEHERDVRVGGKGRGARCVAAVVVNDGQVVAGARDDALQRRDRRIRIDLRRAAAELIDVGRRTDDGDAFHAAGIERGSEETTSELQALMRISYAVFYLKKKKR